MSGFVVALSWVRVRRRRRRPRRPQEPDLARLFIAAIYGALGVAATVVGAPAGAAVLYGCAVWMVRLTFEAWNQVWLTPRQSARFVVSQAAVVAGVAMAYSRV